MSDVSGRIIGIAVILTSLCCLLSCAGKQEKIVAADVVKLRHDFSASPQQIAARPNSVSSVKSPTVLQPLPSASITDDQVDAHIPTSADFADHEIIREAMLMLPPRLRQYVVWLHVPEGVMREHPASESLPNRNLLITLDMHGDGKQGSPPNPVGGCCVLYFNGQVQPHSNLTYEPFLDSYLIVGTHDWQYYLCSPTGQLGLTCARTAYASPKPIPVPSATNCAMFSQMYPPTQKAFEEHHLNESQRAEVLKWVAKMTADDKKHARWMFNRNGSLIIFSAPPQTTYETWQAVNTNIWINPFTCEYYPYPGA